MKSSVLIIISTICCALLAFLLFFTFCLFTSPGSGSVVYDLSFPSGSGIKKLAIELKKAGVIRSSWHFVILTRLKGNSHKLKAGEYRLNDGMTPDTILSKIVSGDVDYRKFTLPEGYSTYQAAELLEQKGYFNKEDFLKKCRDKLLLAKLGLKEAASAEGYLYPATYNLPKLCSPEQLLDQMIGQFNKEFYNITKGEVLEPVSRHNIVTLASIIEREAVSSEEKCIISSVFHNRLRVGMPLQSDPTAVYGIRNQPGKVSKTDIQITSPYNTYLNRGLPPGPIGNPGRDSMLAAMNPAKTDYLYFVARKDGTHQFSRTLEEHNRAVVKYLKH
ncbi:MAG: endolytic transglycosylase MltG [Desulfuromonadaceae bacterium]|nr:endolytic transglycosylase MltG [Desulfuromonadaceae bacterium]MDD2856430.1 endolytic transglycosylase MltG [Desulfuromonadaceae bacterium]